MGEEIEGEEQVRETSGFLQKTEELIPHALSFFPPCIIQWYPATSAGGSYCGGTSPLHWISIVHYALQASGIYSICSAELWLGKYEFA